MPSSRKSSKVSKQEQTDRAIAVVVVILFLGITIFLMTGNERSEIIEKLSTSAIQEDIADDDLYGDEPDELSDEMEICLLYTSPSPRDRTRSRMPSSA